MASAYGIVSCHAQQLGWDGFDDIAEIERLGGALVSHSHTHNYDMSRQLTRRGLGRRDPAVAGDHPPGAHQRLVPAGGAGVHQPGRRRSTGRLPPLLPGASGPTSPTGTRPRSPTPRASRRSGCRPGVAIFNNVPAPDYAWFYSPLWMYTLAEGTQQPAADPALLPDPGRPGRPLQPDVARLRHLRRSRPCTSPPSRSRRSSTPSRTTSPASASSRPASTR